MTKSGSLSQTKLKRLFLVDGMSHIFRAFYAIRHLSNSQGKPTNAIYGFASMIRKLIRQHQPDYLAIVLDTDKPTFRHEVFQAYKANRTKMPDDLASQLPSIREFCQAMKIPIFQMARFEADDIIGTLALRATRNNLETVIVSNDKDMFQLVDSKVQVLHQAKTDTFFNAVKVEEFFGVAPNQVIDFLGLMGDSADNIPGAPGIGAKGALDLVRQYGSIDNILAKSNQVKRKTYRESLQNHQKQIIQSKELVTIDTDVPIDFSWESMKIRQPNLEQLKPLLSQLGFQSMMEEIAEKSTKTISSKHSIPVNIENIAKPSHVDQFIKNIRGEKPSFCWLDFDFQNPRNICAQNLVVIRDTSTWIAQFGKDSNITLEDFKLFWEDSKLPKVFFDVKPVYLALRQKGLKLMGVQEDTVLISYLLQPNRNNHLLDEMAMAFLEETPLEVSQRCAASSRIFSSLEPQLEKFDLNRVYREIDLPLVEVLAELEWNGIQVDVPLLDQMSVDFEKMSANLSERIFEVAGAQFNLNSPKQLGEILFEHLNLPSPRKLKKSGQYSTSVEVLEQLANTYEVPRLMLEFRQIAKLKSGYIDALPRLVNPETKRIHPSFHQTVTATGRLSCSNPNIQNIPVRSELGSKIRSVFIAKEGCQLLAADYSQIELRVLAHLSQDEVLTDAFLKKEDIHTRTASEVFGIDPLFQTNELRRRAKTINFGIIYGQTAFGLAKELKISNHEAQNFISRYFETYVGVKTFINQTITTTEKSQSTRTLFGRHRQIPDINSHNKNLRHFAQRTAVNSPIQGTAADLIKLAMIQIHYKLRKQSLESKMLLQVHDELVFEVPENELSIMKELVKQEMEGVYKLLVPLVVDVSIGKNWMKM